MADDQKQTTERRPSAYEEAMFFTRAVHGHLTSREQEIAGTAARAAYRWARREMIEFLNEGENDQVP